MSTHNLCFRAKIIKNVYPCTPEFYYVKVGCKGYESHGHVILIAIARSCNILRYLPMKKNVNFQMKYTFFFLFLSKT